MLSDKQKALVKHLVDDESQDVRDAVELAGDWDEDDEFDIGQYRLAVLTDSEADIEWDQSLESHLEECIYPELPENMRFYFDDEKWKKDARMDGRGHSLSCYDGNEFEQSVNNESYYIYRR